MIAPQIVAEIRRLAGKRRHSQRQIAHMLGVSRGTVAAIASGKRPDYESIRPKHDDAKPPAGPPKRCPGCGGLVYLPCVFCLAQSKRGERRDATSAARRTPPVQTSTVEESPDINLRPDHHARFVEVHAEKQRQEKEWLASRFAAADAPNISTNH